MSQYELSQLNDVLREAFPIFMAVGFGIVIIVAMILIPIRRKADRGYYGDGRGVSRRVENTVVVSKRSVPYFSNPEVPVYFALFEFPDGRRVELGIKRREDFGVMMEGDIGTLEYAGKTFIAFYRKR